jgi:DNA-binding beta-propeller fold protein YncE
MCRHAVMPSYPHAVVPLAGLLFAAACTPSPRWVAVAVPPDHSILLFDGALHPAGRLAVPGEPTTLESTGDGMSLLVGTAAAAGGRLVWLGRADDAVVLDVPLPGPARDLRLHNDGRTLFALSAGHPGGVSLRGTTALTQQRWIGVCDAPQALAFTREGDQAYVTCAPGSVAEVDPTLEYLVRRTFVAADSGRACGAGRSALSPNNTFLYIPCAHTGRLLYVDRVTLKPWDSTDVGVGISAVAAAPGALAVVLQPDSDRVVLVDLARRARLAAITTPPQPTAVTLSADGRLAFVVCAGRAGTPGVLLQLDARTGAVLARAALPAGAGAVYAWPGPYNSRMHWGATQRKDFTTEGAEDAEGVFKVR